MLFSYYKRPLFILLSFYAVCIIAAGYGSRRGPAAPPAEFYSRDVSIEGRVREYPVSRRGNWRFELRADRINGSASGLNVMAYVRDMGGASYGDTVRFTARLREPFNYGVPGNLDWRGYLAGRGIASEARGEKLEIVEKAPFFIRVAQAVRTKALQVFAENFTPDQASVLSGIVMGEKKSVSDGLKKAFQDSGAMHILVASGSNVGFVTLLVYFLSGRAGLGRKYAGFLALACAGFYVAAAGFDPPLVRGYVMAAAAFTGFMLGRYPGGFQGLVLACLWILVLEPQALFDASFQMSFIAAYGIVVGMALWGPICRVPGFWNRVLTIILVSFFAQIGLYPLMALYFHKVSLISLLSNVALVPASGALMGLGFLCMPASYCGALFGAVKPLIASAVGAFIWLVGFFASLPWSAVRLSPPSALTMCAFFVFVFALLHAPLFGFRNKKLYFIALPALLVALTGARALPAKNAAAMFSDGDTHSVIIKKGAGAIFLVNPGMDGEKLANAALYYGFREVDGVFISTLDRKNWGGFAALAGGLGVRKAVLPYGPLPGELEDALSAFRKSGGAVVRAWDGDMVDVAGVPVRAVWREGSSGYGGNTAYEGLDWRFSGGDFTASVEDAGRRVSWSGADSSGAREAKRGELVEFGL